MLITELSEDTDKPREKVGKILVNPKSNRTEGFAIYPFRIFSTFCMNQSYIQLHFNYN